MMGRMNLSLESLVRLFLSLHPLDRVPRAGYLLRGVTEPESVAAHSYSLALLTLLVADSFPPPFDTLKAVRIALIHDIPESQTMDIPLTVDNPAFRSAKLDTETRLFGSLFSAQQPDWEALFSDFQNGASVESRLVKGLDKVQMMIKVLGYQREGRGRLDEFWHNPENFKDYGIPVVNELFACVRQMAERERLVSPST